MIYLFWSLTFIFNTFNYVPHQIYTFYKDVSNDIVFVKISKIKKKKQFYAQRLLYKLIQNTKLTY